MLGGAIPAPAGNPQVRRSLPRPRLGHPRTCGESRLPPNCSQVRYGAIPAPAGNPGVCHATPGAIPGHPRTCGESCAIDDTPFAESGPSPHLRGIRAHVGSLGRGRRAIPAPAGNPASGSEECGDKNGHPRTCGESCLRTLSSSAVIGPSPHLRGILPHQPKPMVEPGAIPAPAGNPGTACPPTAPRRGHPRTCGESR